MKIVVSDSSRGAYKKLLEQLRKNINGAANNIVLAPDRFTASVERGIISSLKIQSSFGIEIMSFTRLANKLIGTQIKKCLTPEGSVMLISKVIADNRDKLGYYARVANKEGFASELYAALTAIRNSGISVQALDEKAQEMPAGLNAKAKDIALIYNGYLAALEGRHSDSSTRLYALARYIKENPQSVASTHFYCTDIYEFSAPELEIMKGLAEHALSLTVGVTSGFDNQNKRIYPDRVIKKLQALAEGKAEIVRHNDEELCEQMRCISTQLFSYDVPKHIAENRGKVAIRCARDRYDEVLSLALDVRKHVLAGGRYKDFEVYLSDIADYESEIKAVFARYDIPFFIDKKALLCEQTKVRYILEAIACVRSGFRRREVLDFVKNPLFWQRVEGGEDSVFKFENYVLKYNIDYSRFRTPFTLCEKPKYADNSQKSDLNSSETQHKQYVSADMEENRVPELVRGELMSALAPLDFASDGKQAFISEFSAACKHICNNADTAWKNHVARLSELSEYYHKCAEQVDSKIESVLEEIEEVRDDKTDIEGFEGIFKSMLKTLKIALVPTFLDCVFVGDADSRFMGGGDIYILGATQGKFPPSPSGGAVLTPKDEEVFERLGLNVTPDERQKAMINMYAACDLMKKPRGRLVVSYAEVGDGGALRASTVIAELCGMLSENGKPIAVEYIDFYRLSRQGRELAKKQAALLFGTKRSCYHEVLKNAVSGRGFLEDAAVYGSAYECLGQDEREGFDGILDTPERIELKDGGYFDRSTSVSRLESFFGCPYSHYFSYILSLKKRKDGEFEGTENGTVLHFVLEKFFADVKSGCISGAECIRQKAYEYFDAAIKECGFEVLLAKPDTGRLLMRVREEGVKVCSDLYEIYLRSDFKPAMLEAKIGENGILPMSLDIGGKKINLKGVIDRVDVFDDKFAVIDYKTYKSADLTLKELYYGQKIQLYIYMRAVRQSLKLKPAGVFYLPIFAGFATEDISRYKYKGQVSNDFDTLVALDKKFAVDPTRSVLPYKADKKGLSPDVHLSVDRFDMLADYASRVAARGADEIANGYIKPSPVKDRCKKCNFAAICAYRDCNVRRASAVTMSVIEEALNE